MTPAGSLVIMASSDRGDNRRQAGSRLLGPLALRNVFDGDDDAALAPGGALHASRVEQHAAATEVLEVPLDEIVLDGLVLGQNLFEQRPQPGNVPLTIPQRVDELPDGVFRCHAEWPR